MAKNITIDDLAGMIKRGFDSVDQRFDSVDQRFVGVEKRLGTLEQKVDAGFQHMNARLDRIRDDISDVPAMREELQDLTSRVHRLEQKAGLAK